MPGNPERLFTRRTILATGLKTGLVLALPTWAYSASGEPAGPVDPQPYFAGLARALDAMANLGAPVSPAVSARISELARRADAPAVSEAEGLLASYTLANLTLDSAGECRVARGGAALNLVEQGWSAFLVRVDNRLGRPENIGFGGKWWTLSGMMAPNSSAQRASLLDTVNPAPYIKQMWLGTQLHDTVPLIRFGREIEVVALSGIPVEYRVIELFARDSGSRTATLTLETFPGSSSQVGAFGKASFDFTCLASRTVSLGVLDTDGKGCVASLTIRDARGRIYPLQGMRLAPDMFFQQQVYRGDGETMRLPDGTYQVESRRGPEYLTGTQAVSIGPANARIDVRLVRWVDPSRYGWYSGDTHIHAGGCSHYQHPTEGVTPETMIRHVRGEGLSVGDVLTWGPSWYYQKQFFTGKAVSPCAVLEHPELQSADNASLQTTVTATDAESTLRYDVEVSGFPSSHAGHLVLLRLREQDYPGTRLVEDWPSWNLPILTWARSQGALAGYAHCGSGMIVDSKELPNYVIPPMDGIGTQEAIVDIVHGQVDFISGCDTPPAAELNAWYHMMNCGFRLALVGETDFPCISGDRVGVGRSYVKLDGRPEGDAGYEAWILGIRRGRLYCGDGRSHFLDFRVNGHAGGEPDIEIAEAGSIRITANVAAWIEPVPTAETEGIRTRMAQPENWGWHIEASRIGSTRTVPVELIVNGESVARTAIVADGAPRGVTFDWPLSRSSWVALRILPSSHTHPVFVNLDGKPIRASARSARWCRQCVDKLWEVKEPFIRESERPAALAAFDTARKAYEDIESECAAT